jgi:replicative DNA helicase
MLEIPTRIPPSNLDAENAVLGALLMEGRALVPRVMERMIDTDFYMERNRVIFGAIKSLFEKGQNVDLITLCEELRRIDQLEFVGGPVMLAQLSEQGSIAAYLDEYIGIVLDMSFFRDMIQVGTLTVTAGFDAKNPEELAQDVTEKMFRVLEKRVKGRAQRVSSVLRPTLERIEDAYHRKSMVTGISTGFERLDAETGGFQDTNFIIIAARPSMGKTAFALNVSAHAAIHLKLKVLFLSLEMSAIELVQRLLCSEARVDYTAVRTGHLTNADWNRLTVAADRLSTCEFYIDDSPGATVIEARAKAKRMKLERGLDMVVIDYLQLMSASSRGQNRQQDVSEISRSLKLLAKELSVPVIALSQLSRAVEQRANKDFKPQLSDLRESGSLEQDADLVLFLYRASMYRQDLPPEELNVSEVIIGKQRNGPVGTVKAVFLPEYAKFENYSDRQLGS